VSRNQRKSCRKAGREIRCTVKSSRS
jgi:hypothetical protein